MDKQKEPTLKEKLAGLIYLTLIVLMVIALWRQEYLSIACFLVLLFTIPVTLGGGNKDFKMINTTPKAIAFIGIVFIIGITNFSDSKTTDKHESNSIENVNNSQSSHDAQPSDEMVVENSTNKKLDPEWQKLLDHEKELLRQADNVKDQKSAFEDKCISRWDGACNALERVVKYNMKDPSSYEHIDTRYKVLYDEGYMIVVMKYRGKNSFGAFVINRVEAKVSFDCEVLSVQSI